MKKLYCISLIISLFFYCTNLQSQCLSFTQSYQTLLVRDIANVRYVNVNNTAGPCWINAFSSGLPSWITGSLDTSFGNLRIKLEFKRNLSSTTRYHTLSLNNTNYLYIEQQGSICQTYLETPFMEFDFNGGNKVVNKVLNGFGMYGYGCTDYIFTNIPSWITISNNSDVNCLPNNTGNPRYAIISYSDNTNYNNEKSALVVYQGTSNSSTCTPSFSKDKLNFDLGGGTDSISVGFSGNGSCTSDPLVFFNVPAWLTLTSTTPSNYGFNIGVNCNPNYSYSQDIYPRYAEILCLIPAKNIIKRITINQKSVCCSICEGNVGGYYIPAMPDSGGVQTYPVSYPNSDCGDNLVFTNVPSWVTLENGYSISGSTSSLVVRGTFLPNLTSVPGNVTQSRTANIGYHIPNSSVSGNFILTQYGCDYEWYRDSDGDGFGDYDSPVIVANSCIMPFPGLATNKLDKCPNIYNLDNYGCETGYTGINWISTDGFDLLGNPNSSSKTYFDDLGKPTESLSKDFVINTVWGSETTYDSYGRKFRESFPSKTKTLNQTKFLSNSSNKSTYLDKYYSNANTDEPYQATATQPYSEINYDKLNPGNVISVVGGNQIDGVWKTGQAYTVPAAQEMYYLYGYNYFDGPIDANNEEEIVTKFYKTVGVDANGNENVSFSDGEGKLLATARSGGTNGYPVHSLIGTQGYVDVHIPKGIDPSAITLIGAATQYKIYDLKTGLITTTPMTGGNAYRIEALVPPTTESKVYVLNDPLAATLSYSLGALGVSYAVNYYDFSLNVYNKTGQLVKNVQPNGAVISHFKFGTRIKYAPAWMLPTATAFVSTYIYNDQGLVKQSTSPDQGMSTFAYRQDGQIRYSQSALQRIAPAKISYTDYDSYGRPVESGVMLYATTFDSLIPDNAIPSGTRSEQTFTVYDYDTNNVTSVPLATTQTLSALLTASGYTTAQIANYQQKNLSGNVAMTYTKPAATITAITWYSYDIYGRAEWVVQYNEGIGTKIIDYEYDYKGNVKKVLYQKNKPAEMFVHQYTYDGNDVLQKVETSSNNTTFDTHADYSYYSTGELKRLNIAQGAQGLDYVYTLGGALKSINHPSLEQAKDPGNDPNDVFGVILDYYNGDYQRANTNIASSPSMVGTNQDFIGNIKAARFSNKKVAGDFDPGTGTANQKAYTYTYNRNNWLTQAKFGTTNNTGTITNPPTNRKGNFFEGAITYDANGNILGLTRTGNTGAATATTDALTTDQLRYFYSNNRLQQVIDFAAPTPTDPTDIEGTTNYTYDAIGQLTSNSTDNLNYFYNTQGLVTEVRKGTNPIVKFYYNERGHRIKKESFNSITAALLKTDYYVLDLAGNLMSLYTQLPAAAIIQQELPIYGLSRLGVYSKQSGTFNYQITDHLGNVRAVINKIPGNPVVQVVSFADYYPFGEQLPGRNSNAGNYRYAYQGQELDPETGMEAFQLRLWDGRLGRWLSTDPYGQYASPYLGMGNNPVSRIDPDGGTDGPGLWGWVKNLFSSNNPTEQYGQLDEVVVSRKSITGSRDDSLAGNTSLTVSQHFGSKLLFESNLGDRLAIKQYNSISTSSKKLFDANETFFTGSNNGNANNNISEGVQYSINTDIGNISYRPIDGRVKAMMNNHKQSNGISIGSNGIGFHTSTSTSKNQSVGMDVTVRPGGYTGLLILGAIITAAAPEVVIPIGTIARVVLPRLIPIGL